MAHHLMIMAHLSMTGYFLHNISKTMMIARLTIADRQWMVTSWLGTNRIEPLHHNELLHRRLRLLLRLGLGHPNSNIPRLVFKSDNSIRRLDTNTMLSHHHHHHGRPRPPLMMPIIIISVTRSRMVSQ